MSARRVCGTCGHWPSSYESKWPRNLNLEFQCCELSELRSVRLMTSYNCRCEKWTERADGERQD